MAKPLIKKALKQSLPVVAAALIDGDGRVLVQLRPAGRAMAGLWEFPGGKIEPGEAPEDALVRELEEELGIVVKSDHLVPLTFATADLGDRHLLLLLYLCREWSGAPQAIDATALAWHRPAGLYALAMPPADLPFIAALEQATRDHC